MVNPYFETKTLGIPGQSRRRWSPLHSLQGNFTFCGGSEGLPIGGAFGVIAAQLAPFLVDFFFIILFFFFLASWLLYLKISPGEVEEEGEEIGKKAMGQP